ncbi:hypothetical protein [Pseudomonas cavernicola]|nr:hypothetical protein [Pseudomonas cavernicola]
MAWRSIFPSQSSTKNGEHHLAPEENNKALTIHSNVLEGFDGA